MSCRMGCEEPEVSNGLCDRCRKRKARGGDLGAPVQERLTPKQRAVEAAIGLADADSEDDKAFPRAEANFAAAVSRWRDPLVMAEKGRLGGETRAKVLTAERRQEIARIAAVARSQKLSKEERGRLAKVAAQARWKHTMRACRQASIRQPRREADHRPASAQPPVKR